MKPISALSLAALATVAMACHKGDNASAGDSAEAKPVVQVRTAVVGYHAFAPSIGAIGTVQARSGHIASVSAPGPSRVASVHVSLGQRVTAGETLITLDPAPFEAALQSAEGALTAAQQASDRANRLANEGIGTKKDAEQAAADLAKAKADAAIARRNQSLATLKSPISGVVVQVAATLDQPVDVSSALVQVADLGALDIVLAVTPADAARIAVGSAVELRAGQTASGDALGSGIVGDISGTVDTASRTVGVRVVPSSTARSLRIGETVFAQLMVDGPSRSIMIPSAALVPEGDGFKVFVVDAKSMAHERDVEVGDKSDSVVQITKGLTVGERIVTFGAYGVDDSVTVTEMGAARPTPKAGGDSGKPAAPAKPDSGKPAAKAKGGVPLL